MKIGKLTICRHGIIDEDYISLQIADKNSSKPVIEAKISLEHFMREYNLTQDEAKTLEKMYDKNRAKYLDEIRNLKREYPGDEI